MKSISLNLLVIGAAMIMVFPSFGQKTNVADQPQELGKISWYRNIDDAKEKSAATNKPILILFQEVPGCATCRNYGDNVLSHPLLVEVIENEFIPLTIFNNKGGSDAAVLKEYGEPSWNNPVLRSINADGKNIVKRHAGHYDAESLMSYLQFAIVAYGNAVPSYVKLFSEEVSSDDKHLSEAYYSMYCFWTGEAKLGSIEGVVSTSPGFMNGKEVVKVVYDKSLVSDKKISQEVKSDKFSFVTDPSTFRIDRDPQYYLKKSLYRFLPLTKGQRTKINSAIANRSNPDEYLSPKQKIWKDEISDNMNSKKVKAIYDMDVLKSWNSFAENISSL
jgi:copper chaperone CopZ